MSREREYMARLAQVSQDKTLLEALEWLAEDVCAEMLRGAKPPLALDQYGALVAAPLLMRQMTTKMRGFAEK